MAVPAGTFQTDSAIGIREDLEEPINMISPMDTPFVTNARKLTATATLHEWQTDSLASASATNAHIEGDDTTGNTATATVRLGNYTQILKKSPRVSGTQRAVDTAGRADEYDYQQAKRMKEIKRDCEAMALGLQAATAGGTGTARAAAGVPAFLWANQVQQGAAATTTTVTSGAPTTAPTAGTATTFLEANLKSALKSCWDAGGDPSLVMVDSFNKQQASGFSGIATLYRDTQPNTPGIIIGAADTYVSDFSEVQIVANRFTAAGNALVLDMEYWGIASLRGFTHELLAKTGDSTHGQIVGEKTVVALNPSSSAKIYTLTTS